VNDVYLDAADLAAPPETPLPSASYTLEASFYPMWQENEAIARRLRLRDNVHGTSTVQLSCSGLSVGRVKRRVAGRLWVMSNVGAGDAWKATEWTNRFGAPELIPFTGSGNARIIRLFYFPSIDVTVRVNDLRKDIQTWCSGRVTNC
jgi:hypothetical protein